MKPVDKGEYETVIKDHKDAKPELVLRLGKFCSYCECHGSPQQLHVEHIYPQKPKIQKPELDNKINTLGNLTFLGAQDNQVADNEDFSVKRPVFEKSSVSINKEISIEQDWNLDSVNRHEARLIDMALKIFVV